MEKKIEEIKNKALELYPDQKGKHWVRTLTNAKRDAYIKGYTEALKCKYCGATTTQPDSECYKAPTPSSLPTDEEIREDDEFLFVFKNEKREAKHTLTGKRIMDLVVDDAFENLDQSSCTDSTCQVNGFCECGGDYDDYHFDRMVLLRTNFSSEKEGSEDLALKFAEWLWQNEWVRKINKKDAWVNLRMKPKEYTTYELYQIFKQEQQTTK